MKISVFGAGYVGLSLAVTLCTHHSVTLIEIDPNKVQLINDGQYPVNNEAICKHLVGKDYSLSATSESGECVGSDYILIATPTNYDPDTRYFDTSSVDSVIKSIVSISPDSIVVIRSTVPIGYTEKISSQYPDLKILFSPEFLREGNAIQDSLHPSRIVVGSPTTHGRPDKNAEGFAKLMKDSTSDPDSAILLTGSTEAESIKLFSNTYLAMRVAFFNELDSYAELNGLDSKQIIEGVCLDPRIGDYYNNPSFGYGGYCLPKDTKQLLSDYEEIPNSLIQAIVDSNRIRKEFVAEQILRKLGNNHTIGIYRLIMKSKSDNFRESSVIDVIKMLMEKGLRILIYEPLLKKCIPRTELIGNLQQFVTDSDLIVANRIDSIIAPYSDKIYCRDLFQRE
ncbi:nucleotide sugar dehydrogenase [Methanomethylophilus alvi]|uniref:nucleotide sugar dehydrogenase n=1 Tax=Methanomethylophilus alvi TaxID=1291540 RepID=UPI0037DC2F81